MDQLFSHAVAEFQSFINELSNTDLTWTYNSVTVNTTSNDTDYLLPITPGKVLFVTGTPYNNIYGPVALEFANLADVSSDFYPFNALDYSSYSPDFNEAINFPFNLQIAFYRKNNDLWFRLAPNTQWSSINITYSTGDWLDNLTIENAAVLSNHHHLVHTRAAMNLLPAAEWKKDEEYNQLRRTNLEKSLMMAEERYAQQFVYAKRNLTADETSVRPSCDDGWGAFY